MITKYKKIIACGGLVQCQDKFLFIYKRGMWDLPKGKQKGEQSKSECALAEVSEETGVDISQLEITGKLPSTHHMSDLKGEEVYKKVYWFLMKYHGEIGDIRPEVNEDIYGVVWFTREQALALAPIHKRISYLLDLAFNQLEV